MVYPGGVYGPRADSPIQRFSPHAHGGGSDEVADDGGTGREGGQVNVPPPLDTGTHGPARVLGCGGCGPDSIRESQQ